MERFPASGLRRQMLLYFAFIAVVFLTMAVEVTVFIRGPRVQGAVVAAAAPGAATAAAEPLDLLLSKLGVVLGILLVTISLVLTLFIKRVTIPLERILYGAEEISGGNLSVTIPVHTRDELGQLAGAINELAANYQEVLLLVRHHAAMAKTSLREVPEPAGVERAGELLDELEELVGEFGRNYYGERP